MINRPYVIQRCKLREPSTGPTVDGQISFDYMGSSEFEFGALPSSLKRICKSKDTYGSLSFASILDRENRPLVILAPNEEAAHEYLPYIQQMIADTYSLRLKEVIQLLPHITGFAHAERKAPASAYQLEHDIFWDIENDIWFCFGVAKMLVVNNAILATREKKKAEKAEGWY